MQSETNHGTQPMLELVTAMDEIWNMVEGNPELSDHWRFHDFNAAARLLQVRLDRQGGQLRPSGRQYCLRFNIVSEDTDWRRLLQIVYPVHECGGHGGHQGRGER